MEKEIRETIYIDSDFKFESFGESLSTGDKSLIFENKDGHSRLIPLSKDNGASKARIEEAEDNDSDFNKYTLIYEF